MLTSELSMDEIADVLMATDATKSKLAIHAILDQWSRTLFLIMADRTIIIIPLIVFIQNPIYTPNFENIKLIDYGQTIKFGEYESAIDYILNHEKARRIIP